MKYPLRAIRPCSPSCMHVWKRGPTDADGVLSAPDHHRSSRRWPDHGDVLPAEPGEPGSEVRRNTEEGSCRSRAPTHRGETGGNASINPIMVERMVARARSAADFRDAGTTVRSRLLCPQRAGSSPALRSHACARSCHPAGQINTAGACQPPICGERTADRLRNGFRRRRLPDQADGTPLTTSPDPPET